MAIDTLSVINNNFKQALSPAKRFTENTFLKDLSTKEKDEDYIHSKKLNTFQDSAIEKLHNADTKDKLEFALKAVCDFMDVLILMNNNEKHQQDQVVYKYVDPVFKAIESKEADFKEFFDRLGSRSFVATGVQSFRNVYKTANKQELYSDLSRGLSSNDRDLIKNSLDGIREQGLTPNDLNVDGLTLLQSYVRSSNQREFKSEIFNLLLEEGCNPIEPSPLGDAIAFLIQFSQDTDRFSESSINEMKQSLINIIDSGKYPISLDVTGKYTANLISVFESLKVDNPDLGNIKLVNKLIKSNEGFEGTLFDYSIYKVLDRNEFKNAPLINLIPLSYKHYKNQIKESGSPIKRFESSANTIIGNDEKCHNFLQFVKASVEIYQETGDKSYLLSEDNLNSMFTIASGYDLQVDDEVKERLIEDIKTINSQVNQ